MAMKNMVVAGALGLALVGAPEVARAGVQFSFGFGIPLPVPFVVVRPRVYVPPPVYYARPAYGPVYGGPRYYGPPSYPVAERRWKKRYYRRDRDYWN